MVVLTVLVFGGSMLGIAALISWDRMHEDDRTYERLNALYTRSLYAQEMLEKGFSDHDDLFFVSAYEQLEAFSEDALRILRIDNDGSEEADIVRDMFYCYVTPEETMGRLADLRHMRKRVPSMSPVRH